MAVSSKRRRRRGSAWHWKQTDCWYFTTPGSTKRIPLVDLDGQRIRGAGNRQAAETALARIKLAGKWRPTPEANLPKPSTWLVAKVCSEYIACSQKRATNGALNAEYFQGIVRYLNSLCEYCGRLPVDELKKGHIEQWLASHDTWRSQVTRRNAITVVIAAFNYAREMFDVPSPLIGLKKPPPQPRLSSFTAADEKAIYAATDKQFRDFLFVAIHTGLRPFCELARLTADDVEELDRGMMWRIYSTKTKKTRKIPVRPDVATLMRELMRSAPAGSGKPLLRNAQGNPWRKGTGVSRFLKIKRELGWDTDVAKGCYSTYTCRHTFAHRMLSGYWKNGEGCAIETLAELMGDTPKVAFDHYGKEWGQHYQEPLWAAVGM